MASSQSLLGLVNHLQNIELTFTSILLESAIKLSSLTDSNIFVLIETQEGRRFCGSKHLSEAYIGNGLSSNHNDIELEVNPTINAVQEKRVIAKRHSPNQSRKRSACNDTYYKIAKRKPFVAFSNQLKQTSRTRSKDLENIKLETNENFSNIKVDTGPKSFQEIFTETVDEQDLTEMPITSIDNLTNDLLSHGDHDKIPVVPWQSFNNFSKPSLVESNVDLTASEQDQAYKRFLHHLAEDGRRKIEAIQSFGDDKVLFLKGSAPQKILSSLCYSLGKAVSEACIEYGQVDPKSHFTKQMFVILIDRFLIDHFPKLIFAYAKLRHEIKKTFFSVLNKVKNK